MKKSFALLAGTLPLAVILSGCAQIEESIGNATGNHSNSKNLTVDGKVDGADGSYSTIAPSNEFLDKIRKESLPDGKMSVDIANSDTGEKLSVDPTMLRLTAAGYFFNEFIDSTALEGGAPTLAAWKTKKLTDGTLAPVATTKEWLDNPKGVLPVLTADNMSSAGSMKFIHDGKPRMKDADITFGKTTWHENNGGGYVVKISSDWWVDYRVTDETVMARVKAINKLSDDEVKSQLTAEAQDGKGENIIRTYGTADWYLYSGSSHMDGAWVNGVETQFKNRLPESIVKPEFRSAEPTPPATP